MLGIALIAFMLAYGRMMRDSLLLHYAIVLIVSGVLTFFSAGLWPQFSFFFQWLVNFATYAAVFTIGHLIGRLLDRGKYDA